MRKVKVPSEVIDLLADLRTYLQEKCEPPVYVSDRRLVKALNLLQVSAPSGPAPCPRCFVMLVVWGYGFCQTLAARHIPPCVQT